MISRTLRDLRWTLFVIGGLLAAAGLTALLPDGGAPLPGGPPAWRILAALSLCVALAIAGGYALKYRMSRKGAKLPIGGLERFLTPVRAPVVVDAGPIEVRQVVKLGAQLELSLVAIEGQRYLIGSTANCVTLLKQWTPPPTAGSAPCA